MVRRGCVLSLAGLMALAAAACSDGGGGNGTPEGTPKEAEVCQFAGQVACGLAASDLDAVLICEVTADAGRVWVLLKECPFGCADGKCLAPPPDAGVDWTPPPDIVEVAPEDVPPPCVPKCKNKICGDDGCDGSCGQCPADHKCVDGKECVLFCEPKCEGKQCGDDGCGGTCGDCPFGMQCTGGLCGCSPHCQDKECGSDGCGGTCGDCAPGTSCSPFGKCEKGCAPACDGKQCGPDGCGSTCGTCPPGLYCSPAGACTTQCYPDCTGKECGSDGCFGVCGWCPCPDCPPTFIDCGPAGKCVQGLLSCSQMLDCMAVCPLGDVGCSTNCYLAASGKAQTLFDQIVDCIITECGDAPTDECQMEVLNGVCNDEYMACVLDF